MSIPLKYESPSTIEQLFMGTVQFCLIEAVTTSNDLGGHQGPQNWYPWPKVHNI